MTIRYLTGTTIVTGAGADAVTANTSDRIIVAPGAVVGATGSALLTPFDRAFGITNASLATDIDVVVQGSVFGTHGGILLATGFGNYEVTVEAGGSVMSDVGLAIELAAERLVLENHGTIRALGAASSVYLAFQSSTHVLNTGTISAQGTSANTFYATGSGDLVLVNTGTIAALGPFGTALFLDGNSRDTVWNAGSILGDVILGGGNDLFQNVGRVQGSVISGEGSDTVTGGTFDDVILDISGANWLAGGDGADTIVIGNSATDGMLDRVFGGVMGGADTSVNDTIAFEREDATAGVNVFLNGGFITAANSTLIAVMTGFENANGTAYVDSLIGSNGANVLTGGNGADWIVGNGGADVFRFRAVEEAAGDQIRDFRRSEGDRIDLSAIDGNTASSTDAFVFRTVRTANAAGEAVVINYGTSAVVNLYTNADNIIDGTFVVVYGEAGVTSLTAADFLL